MDTAKLIQVIETTLTRRGNGEDDPMRIITQYFSPDGTLLAERDPVGTILADELSPALTEQLSRIHFIAKSMKMDPIADIVQDILRVKSKEGK